MVGEGSASEEGKSASNSDPHVTTDADEKDGSESDGDGAEEILEESPDKRWSKRREKVKQRDVPGIDAAYLAMDNETGNEVVWNEVIFQEQKNFIEQEEKLRAVFDKLTHLVHVNLIKFHKYWTDTSSDKPRIIFITEYMSSGSMSRFLQRARSSGKLLNIKAWKKWTTQILSALHYLHQCDPPIVHANLSCNTVFIQQNGLIKIGCVAPNAIHHGKAIGEGVKNMHYVAPELERLTEVTTQTDIYAFGICALEMALAGSLIGGGTCNGAAEASSSTVSFGPESIRKSIDALEDPLQKDFIEKCLVAEPEKRPSARELLFHPVLFEVHSLKLIAAHAIVGSKLCDQLGEDDLRVTDPSRVFVESKFKQLTYSELQSSQVDLEKFLEDVKNGIYPLIAFSPLVHLPMSKLSNCLSLQNMCGSDPHFDGNNLLDTGTSNRSALVSGAIGLPDERANTSVLLGTMDNSLRSNRADIPLQSASSTSGMNNPTCNIGKLSITSTNQHKDGYNGPTSAQQHTFSLVPTERDEGYYTAQSMIIGGASLPCSAGESGSSAKSGGAGTTTTASSSERSYGGSSSGGGKCGETRTVKHMKANVSGSSLQLLLCLDDEMNRQLTTEISNDDTAENLVMELVQHDFISKTDSTKLCSLLTKVLNESRNRGGQ